MILSYDVVGIPQSLDHVTVEYRRPYAPCTTKSCICHWYSTKVNFLLYRAAEGVFSDLERQSLIRVGLPLSDTAQEAAIEEQHLAYYGTYSASHRLYVTWHRAGLTGEAKYSTIVSEVKACFRY